MHNITLLFLFIFIQGYTSTRFITYIPTWEQDPVAVAGKLVQEKPLDKNSIIYLSFASYRFDENRPSRIPDLENMDEERVFKTVSLLHEAGVQVGLSFGGGSSENDFSSSQLFNAPEKAAKRIGELVDIYGFDAVDFDVERPLENIPEDYVQKQAKLINLLRDLKGDLFIQVSIASQSWTKEDFAESLLKLTLDAVDVVCFLEWDLWLDDKHTYAQQVRFDIDYYEKFWKIPYDKMAVGVCLGLDSLERTFTLENLKWLSIWAKQKKLKGLMLWDLSSDSLGTFPFAYSSLAGELLSE